MTKKNQPPKNMVNAADFLIAGDPKSDSGADNDVRRRLRESGLSDTDIDTYLGKPATLKPAPN